MNLLDLMIKVGIDDEASGAIDGIVAKAKSMGSAIQSGISAALSVGTAVVSGAAAGVTALTAAAVNSYADYEQLVGGVETLFKDSAGIVQGYADAAYTSAGLSANAYMETITSFAASMLQSLGGNTAEAAALSDQAVIDMADNANKMGTSLSMIQNAYQGFAKQNYTMLDNLKLGYGGTQKEMYRLMQTAAELDETFAKTAEFSLDEKGHLTAEFADITRAIHIVQTEMGITGTTSREAASTIQGSVASMKAAWGNMLTGIANEDADFSGLVDNLVSSVETALGNLIPRIQTALGGIGDLFAGLGPMVVEALPGVFEAALPGLTEGVTSILTSAAETLPGLVDVIIAQIPAMLASLQEVGGTLISAVQEIAGNLVTAFAEAFKGATGIDLTPLIDSITGALDALKTSIAGMMEGVDWTYVTSAINGFLTTIAGAITMVVTAMQGEAFQNFVGAIKELFSSVSGAVKDALKPVADGIKELFQSFLSGDTGIITSITDAVKAFTELFNSTLAPIMEAVGQAIVTMFTPFVEGLSDIIKAVANAVDGIFQHASKSEAMKVLAEAIVKLFGVFSEFLGSAIETVALAFTKLIEAMGGEAPGVIGAIASALAPVVNFITTLGEDLTVVVEKIKDFIENIFDIETTVEDVFGSLGEIIGSAVGAVVNAFDNFFTKVKEKIDNIKKLFAELDMSKLLGGLGDWASNTWGDIKEGAGALWDGITEGFEEQRNRQTARETYATPQAVVPYENSVSARSTADTANAILSGISNNGGGKTANINLNVDGRTVASAVYDPLNDIVRQKGAK